MIFDINEVNRKKLRPAQDLWNDGLLPNGKYGYGDKYAVAPAKDRRRVAIEAVLTRLPKEYYAPFKEAMKEGAWFVPWKGLWGKAAEMPQKRVTLYVPATLEFADGWVIESLVAHEILHVALGHKLTDCTNEEYQRQEQEIGLILAALGYGDPKDELTKLFEAFP